MKMEGGTREARGSMWVATGAASNPGPQPTRKWDFCRTTNNHKELNLANNLKECGSRFFPRACK